MGDNAHQEVPMKYMLLIYQGATPLPGTPEWDALPQEEQGAVYAAYKALNETPGVTPGNGMENPETATTVRVQDGRTLTTDGPFAEIKEAIGGHCGLGGDDPHPGTQVAPQTPAAPKGGPGEV